MIALPSTRYPLPFPDEEEAVEDCPFPFPLPLLELEELDSSVLTGSNTFMRQPWVILGLQWMQKLPLQVEHCSTGL